ncbi:MAG: hypothetical protein KAT49_05365 [Methanomicrobia archaeon]|nr:hypothetical protein [Methanomicrobia archaeon]
MEKDKITTKFKKKGVIMLHMDRKNFGDILPSAYDIGSCHVNEVYLGDVSSQMAFQKYVPLIDRFTSDTSEKIEDKVKPVLIKENKIEMNPKNMRIGKMYPIIYNDKEHFVIMLEEGVIEIYEVVDPLWKKLLEFFLRK